MELGELSQLIKGRVSIRKWQDKPVPEALLLEAIGNWPPMPPMPETARAGTSTWS